MRTFVVEGEPVSKGRPRFSVVNGHVHTRTPDKTVIYENLVKLSYRDECKEPMYEQGVPLVVQISAYYAIPKSTSNKKRQEMLFEKIRPTKKPDIDNLCKVIMDSLNQIAYYDDSQVVKAVVSKYYSDKPRVHVQIWTLDEYEKVYNGLLWEENR